MFDNELKPAVNETTASAIEDMAQRCMSDELQGIFTVSIDRMTGDWELAHNDSGKAVECAFDWDASFDDPLIIIPLLVKNTVEDLLVKYIAAHGFKWSV